ncbi:MAG: hypothetical protein FJX76_16570 [Armatimonadetes bacterium]|nr:hypothetical protein [Armatimonadota bacterium]
MHTRINFATITETPVESRPRYYVNYYSAYDVLEIERGPFRTVAAALASDPASSWREVDEEDEEEFDLGGDVLYVATWPA